MPRPEHTNAPPSARVFLHPALTHSPDSIRRVQRETGMLVVITATQRKPHLAAHPVGRGQGGDAA